MSAARPQCTTPGCTRLQSGHNRDKCVSCYQILARAVRRGQTWLQLEKKGVIGPSSVKSGRPRKKDGE